MIVSKDRSRNEGLLKVRHVQWNDARWRSDYVTDHYNVNDNMTFCNTVSRPVTLSDLEVISASILAYSLSAANVLRDLLVTVSCFIVNQNYSYSHKHHRRQFRGRPVESLREHCGWLWNRCDYDKADW